MFISKKHISQKEVTHRAIPHSPTLNNSGAGAGGVLPFATAIGLPKSICPCGGGCPNCQSILPIQAKLKIGASDNKYEQEANWVAEQVMRMPESVIQPEPG